MSVFTWNPDYGASRDRNSDMKKVQFGDGYEQRFLDGINSQPSSWKLSFTRDTQTITDIDSFLSGTNGMSSFTWTAPTGETVSVVVNIPWTRTTTDVGYEQIQCTFRQVFE